MEGDRNTFYHVDTNGVVREIDWASGEVVAKSPSIDDWSKDERLPISQRELSGSILFNWVYGDFICQKIFEGMTLTKISELPGVPEYSTIVRWRLHNKDFDEAIKEARSARAEYYHDKIVDSAEDDGSLGKEEVPGRKLQFEKWKWIAEKNDPSTFGTKGNGEGGIGNITIRVNTGINREPVIIEGEVSGEVTRQSIGE